MVPYRKFFIKLLLILIGTVLAFSTSILIDRLIGVYLLSQGYFKAMQPNITEIYETSEFNAVAKISPQGIRNELVTVPKPKGVYRILAIGDSFTFGWGVNLEDSWPKVLEKLLSKEKRVEVINAGIWGATPDMDVEICRRYQYFNPDLIIFGFFSTDDLYQVAASLDNRRDDFKSQFFPNLTQVNKPILFPPPYYLKDGNVRLSSYWKDRVEVFAKIYKNFFHSLNLNVQKELLSGRLNPGLITQSRVDPDYLIKLLDEGHARFGLNSVEQVLSRAKNLCAKNTPMVLVFLPSQELVSEKFFSYKRDLGFNVSDKLLSLSFDEELKKITDQYGFYFMSLLDDFRREQCVDCFYKYDMHLTPLGNKKVAEYLSNKISAMIKENERKNFWPIF